MAARLTAIEFEWAYMRWALVEGVSFDEYDVVARAKAYVRGEHVRGDSFAFVEKTFAKLKREPDYR
jgi:hypothetical protein